MIDPRFKGSGVALVTPFADGAINGEVLRDMIRYQRRNGTAALVVCGSTGEAAAMCNREQREVVEIAVSESAGTVPVIAGCGGSDTRAVAKLAQQARAAGADALLVSAPPYNKPTQRGIVKHFREVIAAADLPTIVYNVPSRTAVNILPGTVAVLAEDERVIGVKEAATDLAQVAELFRLTGDRLLVWSGNDDLTLPILALGGAGVISVLGNVAPEPVAELVKRYREGDASGARALFLRYLPLARGLFVEPNPVPVKAAMEWLGFQVGPPRLPLCRLEDETAQELTHLLRESGLSPWERRG